ncbi:MAG: LuxR C-terminal-related transcriptional regulator [Planctomycetota bacterium]
MTYEQETFMIQRNEPSLARPAGQANQQQSVQSAIPQRVVFAASKDAAWLAKVGQAAKMENCRLQTASSITSLITQAAACEQVACILLDYDPRIQQWTSIEQLLFEKTVAAPVVLVLDDSTGISASEAVARIAHVVAVNSMEPHEIAEALRDASALQSLVEHQFDVLRCHRLYGDLPDRQRQIVDFVVEGAPNKQIATRLKVSVKTIERERQKAYRALNVRSTAEMTRVVILGSLHDVVFPIAKRTSTDIRWDTSSDTKPVAGSKAPSSNPVAAPSLNGPIGNPNAWNPIAGDSPYHEG